MARRARACFALAATASVLPGAVNAQGFGVAVRLDFPTASLPMGLARGDVNGDGVADLVSANAGSGTVSVFLGDGRTGFGARTGIASAAAPYALTLRQRRLAVAR
jgi:hypothetical protein